MNIINAIQPLRYVLLGALLLGLGGCDYLSYDETSYRNRDFIFSSFNRTKQFVNRIYGMTPGGLNSIGGAMREAATDNAEEVNTGSAVQAFNDGSWSAVSLVDPAWGSSYEGIRAANRFLEEGAEQTFEEDRFNDDYEQQMQQYRLYPYEVRFLRAYFYFELAKRYGDVPLIARVLEPSEANTVEPPSFQEIIDFIISECEAIAPELPVDYHNVPQQETGRSPRGAAMALKARALLYAASPLHNPSGEQEKWIRAAEAAKALIDSAWYALEPNYSNVVNNRTSSELIWGRRHGASNEFERSNFPVGYEGADPGTAPTQNLVDAYEMKSTGLGIDKPGSGYNPSTPYQNRDPRLKATILRNGSMWKGRKVETWTGGRDGPPQENATETGYYLKKYVIEDVSLEPGNTTTVVHTWVVFRYGEILLNYAEAMNEAYGPDDPAGMGMTAREAVNQVRQRAGMPVFPVGLSREVFRQKVRNERRVELAFEGHRFWDIRRWQVGPSTTEIDGMAITRNEGGSFDYQRELVEQRLWEDRMYLYPIPQSELFKNDNLEQNSGW